jgi:CubicO group peptidase (beta-lactamase class C family)
MRQWTGGRLRGCTMATDEYFPPSEADGGWRYAESDEEVREWARLDPRTLALAETQQGSDFGEDSWCISIIRNGVLAAEFRSVDIVDSSRFDVWSCTKSFTSLAFGIILNEPAYADRLNLESAVYEFIPEGHPLTDERKVRVTVGQLLSMTGGFVGHDYRYVEKYGRDGQLGNRKPPFGYAAGTPTRLGDGLFEHLLGRVPNRWGCDAGHLVAEPGSRWEYSDPGFSHLSLVFAHITGSELDSFLNERLFGPVGVPPVSWSRSGGGKCIGPHTVAHCGLVLSSRELARCGYLLLRRGVWDGRQLVSEDWIERATRPSQPFNPQYGYGFWVNTNGNMWKELPTDAFAMMGYRGNRCWVVPSLDLVVARTGSGPQLMDDSYFPSNLIDAVL